MSDAGARGRLGAWMPLLLAVIMILGMVFGYRLHDSLKRKQELVTFVERSDRLQEIISLINNRYVDSVHTDQLYGDAVRGILTHLDPHTVYIPTEDVAGVNEDLEGEIYGIGVEYVVNRDTMQVTAVVEGGPADKAGIIVADEILRINDSVVAGNGFDRQRVARMMRGARNTNVRLTIRDAAKGGVREVIAQRDAVPVYSVEAALLLNAGTGFIRINRFTANTYDEFMKAAERLKREGAANLIIDLRDNPGGYLDAAVQIADELIGGDHLLVYTQGLHAQRTDYHAEKQGLFEQGNIAVLIDQGSASASEILAGAVQDWDRGVILGRRSFGKGLVQEQYDLSDGSALRLTVARYFTPSGRSIQRSYAQGRDAYAAAYHRRLSAAEADSVAATDTSRYFTANQRVVYGGGGIQPDVALRRDSAANHPALVAALYSEAAQQAVWDYYATHRAALLRYASAPELAKDFRDAPLLLERIAARLPAADAAAFRKVLAMPAVKAAAHAAITAQVAQTRFRQNGYYAVYWPFDHDLAEAERLLRDARAYSALISGKGAQP